MRALRWTAALAVPVLMAVACTPAPGTPGTTTSTSTPGGNGAPSVVTFVANPVSTPAPALTAFSWSVQDPDGDALTCSIDGDGNGSTDVTVSNCQTPGSRNVALATAGFFTAKLTVSDGTSSTQDTTPVVVQAGVSETFDVVLRPVSALDPDVAATFAAAEARWESILVRGIPDVSANVPADTCLTGAAPIVGTIDDLIIDVRVGPIDGPGQVLGQAGPCLVANGDDLPRVGVMEFDEDDVANLLATGRFDEVILHEMAHVLGLGTVWTDLGLLIGDGGADPRFIGTRAVAEWSLLGRTGTVPVEAGGGGGTAYSHWRESTFGSELMTGWIGSGANPLSRLSIASFADLGYQVDLSGADAYSLPSGSLQSSSVQDEPGTMILRTPTGTL